jgi:hypothetical protein
MYVHEAPCVRVIDLMVPYIHCITVYIQKKEKCLVHS